MQSRDQCSDVASLSRSRVEQVEAEEVPDVSEKMDVAAVPFFTLHRVRDATPPLCATP